MGCRGPCGETKGEAWGHSLDVFVEWWTDGQTDGWMMRFC